MFSSSSSQSRGSAREFQQGMNSEEHRRKRETDRLRLRKQDRHERNAAKRRAFRDRRRHGLATGNDGQNGNGNNNPNGRGNENENENGNERNTGNDNNANAAHNQSLQKLDKYVKGCYMASANVQIECCKSIRKLLSMENKPPIDQVIRSGVVPRLVQFLHSEDSNNQNIHKRLQFEAAWALTNIASGTAIHTAEVMRSNAVPHLIALMGSASKDVAEQAAWGLGNIAGESPQCRDNVLNGKGLDGLVALQEKCIGALRGRMVATGFQDWNDEFMRKDDVCKQMVSLLRNVAWTLSNFVRGKPAPAMRYCQQAAHALKHLLPIPDSEICGDACWGLHYVTDDEDGGDRKQQNGGGAGAGGGSSEQQDGDGQNNQPDSPKIEFLRNEGILEQLIACLASKEMRVRHPALRALGNVATSNDKQTQYLINLGMLDRILPLLNLPINAGQDGAGGAQGPLSPQSFQAGKVSRSTVGIVREACWLISNITAGTKTQIEHVFKCGDGAMMRQLLFLLDRAPYQIRREAAWAISNVTSSKEPEHMQLLVDGGILPILCKLLEYGDANHESRKRNSKASGIIQSMVEVVMEAMQNILAAGEVIAKAKGWDGNPFADMIETHHGLDRLEAIQCADADDRIFDLASSIVKTYWHGEDSAELEDGNNENNTNNGESGNSNMFGSNDNSNQFGASGFGGNNGGAFGQFGANTGFNANNNNNNNNGNNNGNNGNNTGFGFGTQASQQGQSQQASNGTGWTF